MKKHLITLLAALIILAILAPALAIAQEEPERGGTLNLILARGAISHGFPPNVRGPARDYIDPLFDRLMRINEKGEYEPMLATSWKAASDGMSYTFKLRQGVKFHDGSEFNASAAKWNLENLMPPKKNFLSGVSSVEVVDDYTIRVNLEKPNNLVLYQLAAAYEAYIYSPTAFKKHDANWAGNNAVGTGPFMKKSFNRNTGVVMVKNPNYWVKGLPYLDGINAMTVLDQMTQTITMESGQANCLFNAQPHGAVALRNIGFKLISAPGSTQGIAFDTKNSKKFANKKVREAIEYAIDKEAICAGPARGVFPPAFQLFPEGNLGYNSDCPPRKYNPKKAKQLLAEAGYPDGFEFKFFRQSTTFVEIFDAIQAYLADVGIKMNVADIPRARYNLIRVKGEIEPGATTHMSANLFSNPLYVLDYTFRSDSNAYQFFKRPPEMDALIAKAKESQDHEEVTRICQQLSKVLYDDVTFIPLFRAMRIVVLSKEVQNTGYFIGGDANNNMLGQKTWIKK